MAQCQKICRTCHETKPLFHFFQGRKRFVQRCKECYYVYERQSSFSRNNCGLQLQKCQCIDCPDTDIASDKRLLRLRDDGIIACLGCCRFKKRKGKNIRHRDFLLEYFKNQCCKMCSRSLHLNNIDFFEMIEDSGAILHYSKYIKLKMHKISEYFQCGDIKLVCLICAKNNITEILR